MVSSGIDGRHLWMKGDELIEDERKRVQNILYDRRREVKRERK